ncbi:Leucine-rich repeat domain, L domain-like [Phytophthora cactorum]|nr:Leucine-rich repeat domain, L domain-like [Phytophthora cactorum]
MKFLALVALLLAPSQAFFFHYPSVHGDSYIYKGDGDVPDHPESLFQPDDTFTDVCVAAVATIASKYAQLLTTSGVFVVLRLRYSTLENWDLSSVASLNLPHTIQKLYDGKSDSVRTKGTSFSSIFFRSLVKCKLSAIPDEVRALENLRELNLAENKLEAIDGVFAASAALIKLNASHNAINSYNVPLPQLTALDLSANALTEFPNAVFASSQLDSFRISGNGFEIVTMSTAQYDFFAGLSDFQAGFADIPRTDKEEAPTPMATVGVVIPHLPIPSNSNTKKYIIAAIIVLMVIGMIAGVIALISLGVVGGIARAVYEYIGRWQKKRHREGIHENTPLFFDQAARASYQKEMDTVDKLFPSNDRVTLVKKIAQGAFGEVWVGQYRNARVAVKRLIQDQLLVGGCEVSVGMSGVCVEGEFVVSNDVLVGGSVVGASVLGLARNIASGGAGEAAVIGSVDD